MVSIGGKGAKQVKRDNGDRSEQGHAKLLSASINPLKPSVIRWLHSECSVPNRPNLPFSVSDIRALWRSALSARVLECQKLKMVGEARMT